MVAGASGGAAVLEPCGDGPEERGARLRKIAAAVLAVPVLVLVYLPLIGRRGVAARLALVLGVGGLIGVAGFGVLPRGTTAIPATTPVPVEASQFGPAVVGSQALDGTILVEFSAPMDRTSVQAALAVEPATPLALTWLDGDQALLIGPASHWAPSTFYAVSIGTGARDAAGGALTSPLRTIFSTRPATAATIVATETAGTRVRTETAFVVTFDADVPIEAARAAFAIEPPVAGEVVGDDVTSATTTTRDLAFLPDEPLAPDTRYVVRIAGGLVDAEGAPVAAPEPLTVRTTVTPSVVRFRPRNGIEDVACDADLSVRFTRKMDRASTEKAFAASVAGKRLTGTLQWFENDTVLLLDPGSDLPYGAKVTLRVSTAARSVDGVALDRSRSVAFTTAEKPQPTPRPTAVPTSRPKPTPTPRPSSGGGSAGSSSWFAAEKYVLRLMNCTRGGGWVEANGSCSSPGGSTIPALQYHAGISDRVARPYAKKLATAGACTHFLNGTTIGSRLRAAGYYGITYGENISCRYYSDPMDAAVALVRFFQSERSWNPPGGHWVNMMNRNFQYVGIGLWVTGGHLNYVVDFFTPR